MSVRLRSTTGILVLLAAITASVYWSVRVYSSDAADDSGLLPIVLEGSQNTASLVKSGKGKVVVRQELVQRSGGMLETETTYNLAFCGDKFKAVGETEYLKNDENGKIEQGMVSTPAGSRITTITKFDGQTAYEFNVERRKGRLGGHDTSVGRRVLTQYELELAVGKGRCFGRGLCDLEDYCKPTTFPGVTSCSGPTVVGRETIDGNECIVVECVWRHKYGSGEAIDTRRFWVDPNKGFTLARVKVWFDGGSYREKTLVAESNMKTRQYSNDVWGPDRYEETMYTTADNSEQPSIREHTVVTFDSGFALNVPIANEDLSFAFPSGTKVDDETLDMSYEVP